MGAEPGTGQVIDDLPAAIRIPAGHNGPARTANGGVAAGTMARLVTGAAEVRLASPPPMATDLPVRIDAPWVVASDGDDEVMRVRPAPGPEVPVPPVAAAAVGDGIPFPDHPASTCIVCGPDHDRGLRVFPAPIAGHDAVLGTWWTPPDWATDEAGHVAHELLWGVLDCPGALAVMHAEDEPSFAALVGITGEVLAPVHRGERVLVLGFALGADGRKRRAGTAVLGPDGDLRAHTRQVCISVPPTWAGGT